MINIHSLQVYAQNRSQNLNSACIPHTIMSNSNNTHAETQPASDDPRAFRGTSTLEGLREQAAAFKKDWMMYPPGSRYGVWSDENT